MGEGFSVLYWLIVINSVLWSGLDISRKKSYRHLQFLIPFSKVTDLVGKQKPKLKGLKTSQHSLFPLR